MKQRKFLVIARDAIRPYHATADAAMDDRPFAVVMDIDADGCHRPAAGASSIARLDVNVAGPETIGAVIAMLRTDRAGRHFLSAMDARKAGAFGATSS